MVGEVSFKRFMNIRQQLFDVLAQGDIEDGDGIVEVKITFESAIAACGTSLNPYQKTKYEIIAIGKNHTDLVYDGDNFENLLDQLEVDIKKMKK